ncbi:MAG: serine hydrolase domain-containing protein [Salinivirgaceae bacterium]|nr:serine hydrolase domain-containing protein [Salinivirgaceae bacterium]
MRKGKTELFFLLFTASLFYILGNYNDNFPEIIKTETVSLKTESPDTSFYSFLRAELEQLFKRKVATGFTGAILVGHDNNVIFEAYKSIERRRIKDTITADSRFQIASISKQFTAVAILQLLEKGLLNLEDSVQKHIPEFPFYGITIHQLLCHRSGLPNYIYYIDQFKKEKHISITGDSLLKMLVDSTPVIYAKPNRRYKYSNMGYVVLSLIVERISGVPFWKYMNDHVFRPIGMDNTEVLAPNMNDNFPNMLKGYSERWREHREDYLNGCYGDKGIYTTARDLFKWDQALYDTIIIKPETLSLAFLPHGIPRRESRNYGYGWRILINSNRHYHYHAGWWQGFRAFLLRVPGHKITIVALKSTLAGSMVTQNELINIIERSLFLSNSNTELSENDTIVEEGDISNHEILIE